MLKRHGRRKYLAGIWTDGMMPNTNAMQEVLLQYIGNISAAPMALPGGGLACGPETDDRICFGRRPIEKSDDFLLHPAPAR